MTETVKIVSPIDGRVYAERKVASGAEIEAAVAQDAHARAKVWGEVTVQGARQVPRALPRRAARA